MELVNLITDIPTDQPRLRLYKDYVSLNAYATRLMGLAPGDYVRFTKPRFPSGDKVHIYVGKTSTVNGAFRITQRGNGVRINNSGLARKLRETLGGEGCYRVCPEDKVTDNGETYYNVFFRKYDKENSD